MPRTTAIEILAAVAIAVASLCLTSTGLRAQHRGTIAGEVFDSRTHRPLAWANVLVVGTGMGTMAMDDGRFVIDGVPVGTYQIKISVMGFRTVSRSNVVVNAGDTTELSFGLEETIVSQTPVIEVFGKKPMVEVGESHIATRKTAEEFKDMPLDNVYELMEHTAGVVRWGDQYYVQGSRPNEVQTQNDDVLVMDPLASGSIAIGRLAAAETEFIAGGMDAEYGNAQAAVFKIKTREGGKHFGGELRYMTDDFGRADRTYTNYDNLSLGFGGPTPIKDLRYYVSTEATFLDGENNSIERRREHKSSLFGWLKARDRMSHSLNLQSKLSWHRGGIKLTGEAIAQRSRREEYHHNWNVRGYARKVYYFQRLVATGTGQDVYTFGSISIQNAGPWIDDVNNPAKAPNPRLVVVEQLVRDAETGGQQMEVHKNFRAVDVNGVTILWDEAMTGGSQGGYRSWVLFEGFQFPFSRFSHEKEDSSFTFFNSASRTPEVRAANLQLKLAFNHNISDELLYTVRLSRLQFNLARDVDGKAPRDYASAGLPATLPSGSYLEGGVSQAAWYTDPDNPYFVTAYDYPAYTRRKSVQYLLRSDITSEKIRGHRTKMGFQFIYNDLNNDDRFFPAQQRRDPMDGTVQQGRNVNTFHNFNTEGAVYLQDKWEYEGLVANAGMRFEYFSTGNTDEVRIHNAEIDRDVEKYKTNWSPRLGVAFPISDRNKFFFHYGRFTQWASRSLLFATQDAIGALGTLGNPNLEPELTVSYQAGISHQFTENTVANFVIFNKDIFGLVSSTRVTDDSTGVQSLRYTNRTYASSRGLELALENRLTHRFGFEAYYTYSFADGVASDADFGRSADGLTHLPTDELPLDWDQRHTFNLTLRLQERNNWGATATYQFGSGLPWTPVDRFARLQDPKLENSRRHDAIHRLSLQGRKRFNIYGRELTLFVEGRNLLDQDILAPGGVTPQVTPNMVVAQMDNGSYLTETGRHGGAYLQDIDDDGVNDFVPVNDPTVFEQHRVWRVGFGFEF
ncbi:MAG: TonB-dependent receptor domain-containing protein [Candidatus Krumholzibacteriia bacterium]